MLIELEALKRDNKRLPTRLRFVGLYQNATLEKIDHRNVHGLHRALFQKLASGEWIERHQDLLVTAPIGTGGTWLSCAHLHRACRDKLLRVVSTSPRLREAPGIARRDEHDARMLRVWHWCSC